MIEPGSKIVVGLSGGVDSSVTAYLLKQQGYEVAAVFMKNWEGDDDSEYCSAEEDFADARAVAQRLDIPLTAVNFSQAYWDNVFQIFLDEYQAGRTPNPDILCNKEIKFKAFLDHALSSGADYIATGHYARIAHDEDGPKLLKGLDENKDQSYFLSALTQEQLAKSLFPLGEMHKSEVRRIASELGLINHAKKDSTGICFIGERKFRDFLQQYLLTKPGDIVTTEQQVIGQHQGLMYYTLGQRQGLNIGGRAESEAKPWYVLDKDLKHNQLIVGQGVNHPRLFAQRIICKNIHWINQVPTLPFVCGAKCRYRQTDASCRIEQTEQGFVVTFNEPQRAMTPGQYAVFYQDSVCLGGGVIDVIVREQPARQTEPNAAHSSTRPAG